MQVDPSTLPFQEAYKLMIGSVLPRPIAWVSTIDSKGVTNLAPFSFFMGVTSKPLTIAFSPTIGSSGKEKDTLRNIRETKQFVVNVVPYSLAMKMNQTSYEYPGGVSEFKEAGITETPSKIVKPPRVLESPVNMECELHTIVDVGSGPGGGSIVVGRIVYFHCDDAVYKDGRINLEKLDLVGRLSGSHYVRTNKDIFDLPRPTAPAKK